MKLSDDLSAFVGLLNEHEVEYVVVGGHAVAFHGYPRYTGDIDFLVRPEAANAQRIIDVLDAFGFGQAGLQTDDFLDLDAIVQLGRPPNRIDLLTSISGVSFDEVWNGRVAGELDGHAVTFIGRDALIRNKRASGRTKDLADIEELDYPSRN